MSKMYHAPATYRRWYDISNVTTLLLPLQFHHNCRCHQVLRPTSAAPAPVPNSAYCNYLQINFLNQTTRMNPHLASVPLMVHLVPNPPKTHTYHRTSSPNPSNPSQSQSQHRSQNYYLCYLYYHRRYCHRGIT